MPFGPKIRPRTKYRNTTGSLIVVSLIYEFAPTEYQELSIFTIGEEDRTLEDGRVLISLYRVYMEMEDISEYDFANKYFESWHHWYRLSCKAAMQKYVRKWRAELQTKLKAKALKKIMDLAETEGYKSFEANKYLLEEKWRDAPAKRGRPKELPPSEVLDDEVAMTKRQLKKDMERLGITN